MVSILREKHIGIKGYCKNLRFLANFVKPFLEDNSKGILIEKADMMINSKKTSKKKLKFRIYIPSNRPLTFKESSEGRFTSHVDLSCEIEGEASPLNSDKIILTKYNVSLRIWSHEEKISYRKRLDAPELKQELENQDWRRVISRFHLDLREANTRRPEPWYHLHFGGRSKNKDNEYCWIPKKLDEPRFCCFPMDLVLLCEFILMNFFPDESGNLRKKPEWKRLVQKSQHLYMRPYLEQLTKFLNNDTDTFLGHLSAWKAGGESNND